MERAIWPGPDWLSNEKSLSSKPEKKEQWRLPPLNHLFSSSVNTKNMEEIYEK